MKKSPADKEKGQSVEDIFRNGFADAESAPPPRIWENVHREIENQELHRYRKQVVWYRSMAAAFLLLLISAGIILWQQDTTQLTGQPKSGLASSQGSRAQKTPSASVPNGHAADVTSKPKASSEVKEMTESQVTPEVLASVSEAFSGKRAQNGESAAIASTRRDSGLARKQNDLSDAMAQQTTSQKPAGTETFTGSQPSMEKATSTEAERPMTDRAILGKSGEDKPFSRSLITGLAFSKGLPSGVDSLKTAPERSILVQKEASVTALAQTPAPQKGNEAQEKDVYKWSVTMAYSPQYAYAPVKLGQNSAMNDPAIGQSQAYAQYEEAVAEYNHSYTPTYSYAALVGASYQINDKWQVETGVLYTQNEATTTQSFLVYQGSQLETYTAGLNLGSNTGKSAPLVTSALNHDNRSRAIAVDRTDKYNTRYRYQQVGLPVRLAYRLNMKKMYALFSGGLNMNLLVQNTIMPQTDQVEAVRYGLNDKDSPFRTVQWATTTSIGVGYDVTKKMSILLAPEFTYSLSPMLREAQQQANTYQLGVSIGGRWRLTR